MFSQSAKVFAMENINVQNGTLLSRDQPCSFSTAEKAAYPHSLCSRIAAILLKYAARKTLHS